ncbi:MAG: response regulator [Chthoniobacterales bacterium]
MLDHEDLKWLAANTAELTQLLRQAARQAEQARLNKGQGEHLTAVSEQVSSAFRTSQAIHDRVTGRLFAGAGGGISSSPTAWREDSRLTSTLYAEMPVGEVAVAEETVRDSLILNPHGARELILLVDDDLEILERTGEILDFEDYRFITAKDGLEALRIYRKLGQKIDLILLDFFLPVINGDAIFDELKAINPRVRVVLSSGFGEQAQLGSMLARGLCAFIPKPYTHEKLIEQIRTILEA